MSAPDLRLAALRRFSVAITVLNVCGRLWLGFENSWAQMFVALGLTYLVTLAEPVDVVKAFTYRPRYFGRYFCDWGHVLMRGPSEWTVGERELFGAFTASLNQCVF